MKHLEKLEEFMEAINDSRLVVVDFYAQWCGPCKRIAPDIEKFAVEYDGKAVFYKVDVDKAEKEVTVAIEAMPTFIFYRNGEQIAMFMGANVKKVKEILDQNIELEKVVESAEEIEE